MVQVARTGNSPRRDFSSGATMYDSSTSFSFRPCDQVCSETEETREIVTLLENEDGLKVRHILTQRKGYRAAELRMELENCGAGYDDRARFFLRDFRPHSLRGGKRPRFFDFAPFTEQLVGRGAEGEHARFQIQF